MAGPDSTSCSPHRRRRRLRRLSRHRRPVRARRLRYPPAKPASLRCLRRIQPCSSILACRSRARRMTAFTAMKQPSGPCPTRGRSPRTARSGPTGSCFKARAASSRTRGLFSAQAAYILAPAARSPTLSMPPFTRADCRRQDPSPLFPASISNTGREQSKTPGPSRPKATASASKTAAASSITRADPSPAPRMRSSSSALTARSTITAN